MSAPLLTSPVVPASWLAEHLDHPDVVVLDASWFLPGTERNAMAEWQQKRIPGARFFDFDKQIADPDSHLPHMLPSPALFAEEVGKLGITPDSIVVVYDTHGIFSSPRVWWMFRAMGHQSVAVLDGGLPVWEQAGYALQTCPPEYAKPAEYLAVFQPQWVIDADSLHARLSDTSTQVFDARPAARFYALQPEPRAGIRSGHMPNAKSLPFSQLLENGQFLPKEQLMKRFDALCEPEQHLIFSCGSGVTACILALGAELSGRKKLTVYDGSWSEWGSNNKYPVEV